MVVNKVGPVEPTELELKLSKNFTHLVGLIITPQTVYVYVTRISSNHTWLAIVNFFTCRWAGPIGRY